MGKHRWGVILDAGSSGTRVYIYKWKNSDSARKSASAAELNKLPEIKTDRKWIKKINPGISSFGDHPHHVGPEHLDKLFSHALKCIPHDEVPNTPLFLLATAGMRILPELQQKAVLEEVCAYARTHTKFQLPDCALHVQVIPGETEGLYGWIAANYLLGGFDKPKGHQDEKKHRTYGFLDMGGASAQIAFAPNATEAERHANDLTLLRLRTLGGASPEYKVFVTTWLGFGVNQARQRYVKALLESSTNAKEYPDPCLPDDAVVMVSDEGTAIESGTGKKGHKLVGTGVFSECLRRTYPLLEKEKDCLDAPCLINGQHTPAIDFDVNHFVGVSEYYYTTHDVFKIASKGEDDDYDFKTYQQAASDFCNKSWKDIKKGVEDKKWGKFIDEQIAQEVCFKSSWLINVLHDGIGVPRVGLEDLNNAHNVTKAKVGDGKNTLSLNPFQAVNKINDVELSWTLGKMVLYASSEIPPSSTQPDALAVGFGSNVPGIPSDFQYPGGSHTPHASSDADWHDRLFTENPRRIPGFLIFVLILLIIGYMTCGRERRKSSRQRIAHFFGRAAGSRHSSSSIRRRRGFLPSKLFSLRGAPQPSYERVLEDGEAGNTDFELGSLTSDEDARSDDGEGERVGRTSGWATPRGKAANLGGLPGFEAEDVVAQGSGLGLGPGFANAIERGVGGGGGGWRSRAGSPRRGKSGLGFRGE